MTHESGGHMLDLQKMTDDAPQWSGGRTPPLHRQSESERDMRYTDRVRFRAKTRARTTVICGKVVKPADFDSNAKRGLNYGTIEFTIYDDDEDYRDLAAKVESDANLATLHGYEETVLRHRREHIAKVTEQPISGIPVDPREWDTAMQDADISVSSVEAEFFRAKGRGIRPLFDLECIEAGIPAPTTREQKHSSSLVTSLVKAMAQTGVTGDGSAVAELSALVLQQSETVKAQGARIDELTATLEELQTRPAAEPSKPTKKPKG